MNKIQKLNESLERYLNDNDLKEFAQDTDAIEDELYLWEHNCIWDLDHIVNCLDQCLGLMGYTKQEREEKFKYYPKYYNEKYKVDMGPCRHPGGYWIHVTPLNEKYPIDGTSGTAEHNSDFRCKPDSVEETIERVVGLLRRIKNENFVEVGEENGNN